MAGMPQVADHLAELTGFRDRDVLDTTLVGVLRELLQPVSVTVCHHVGDGEQQRWLVRARLAEGDVAASNACASRSPSRCPAPRTSPAFRC